MRDAAATAVLCAALAGALRAPEGTAVVHASRLLACHRCRYLPVVDRERIVGIVSARDLPGARAGRTLEPA